MESRVRTQGEILAEARRKAGMTQAQAAIKSGYREKDISRWENGHNELKVRVLMRLYQAYYPHLNLQDFMEPLSENGRYPQTDDDLQFLALSLAGEPASLITSMAS